MENMESSESDVIVFEKEEETFDIKQKNTVIVRKPTDVHTSSSKVKLKNIVDYKWELKPYTGRLVAAHKAGNIIAYTIKAKNHEKFEGMIRIVNVENGKRTLLKGMNSEALDLEFAFLDDPVLLAYINESTLYVQKIEESSDKLGSSIILQLENLIEHKITYDKVTWCPYVPESSFDSDGYASQLITWSRGTTFHCYSVTDITWKYGAGPHNASDIVEGGLTFNELKTNILDIGFSPDGTTLATCTEDGFVRFYQVYLHSLDGTPRRLHEWIPHDGKPVKKIMFLDNLNQTTTDEPLWKNAVTYSEAKYEIKIWCCETWNCLQSLVFRNIVDIPLHLILNLDKTASYMLVSDMYDQQLYVFHIDKFNVNTSVHHRKQTCVKSVAKFPLASQILSFDIVNASVKNFKCGLGDAYLANDIDEYDDENNCTHCVILKMFLVQPKSVQECNLLYQPSAKRTEVQSTISCENPEITDVTDLIKNTESNEKNEHLDLEVVSKEESRKPFKSFDPDHIVQVETKNDDISGKSSPSREVAKILNDVEIYDTYFDTVSKRSVHEEKSKTKEADILNNSEWPNTNTILDNQDLKLLNLTTLISQQSNQLKEIQEAIKVLQKNIDSVNDESKALKSVLKPSNTDNDQIIKQLDQLIRITNIETVKHATEAVQQDFQSLAETLFARIEHYIATKMDIISMEMHSQLDLKNKFSVENTIIDKDQKLSEKDKNDVRATIESTVTKLIETSLIPSFESISKGMLSELNKTLINGTQEYATLFEKHAKLNTLANQMHQSSEQWMIKSQQNLIKTEEILKLNSASLSKELKLMEASITKTIKEQIRTEVSKQFQEQTSAIRSSVLSVVRTQTPVPSSQNLQSNICRLLEQCQINKAFHLALIANDLSLVEFTIKKAEFTSVFQPCNLEQTVLLSLIQQLSADMKHHSELKQKYLAEAIINLNLDDSSIKEHAPRIMNELRQNCQTFVKDNPTSYLTSYVKMLIMASQSVA